MTSTSEVRREVCPFCQQAVQVDKGSFVTHDVSPSERAVCEGSGHVLQRSIRRA